MSGVVPPALAPALDGWVENPELLERAPSWLTQLQEATEVSIQLKLQLEAAQTQLNLVEVQAAEEVATAHAQLTELTEQASEARRRYQAEQRLWRLQVLYRVCLHSAVWLRPVCLLSLVLSLG